MSALTLSSRPSVCQLARTLIMPGYGLFKFRKLEQQSPNSGFTVVALFWIFIKGSGFGISDEKQI